MNAAGGAFARAERTVCGDGRLNSAEGGGAGGIVGPPKGLQAKERNLIETD